MFRHHIRATLIAVAVLVPASLDAQARIDDRLSEGRPPIVIAHRSAAMGGFPENSLAWIDHAIGRGIDMVHINPQLTADGTYVLMHDPTLNRTTDVESVFPDGPPGGPTRVQRGGKDYVRDYELSEIRTLKLVNGTDGGVHSVPTLGEALDLVDGRLLVRLGLKSYEVESLAAALAGRDIRNLLFFELYFSGTDQSKLRRLMEETGIDASVSLFRTRDALGDLDRIAGQLGPGLRLVSVDFRAAYARVRRESAGAWRDGGHKRMGWTGGRCAFAGCRSEPMAGIAGARLCGLNRPAGSGARPSGTIGRDSSSCAPFPAFRSSPWSPPDGPVRRSEARNRSQPRSMALNAGGAVGFHAPSTCDASSSPGHGGMEMQMNFSGSAPTLRY